VSPLSLAFGLFISMLELLVALLQAYIFTLLSAMYIGGAVEEHHDADFQMGGGNEANQAHAH
jgi:F-type H+-transporting ATPase subunit a